MKFFEKNSLKLSLYTFFTFAAIIIFFKVVDNFSSAFDSFRIILDFLFKIFRPFIIGIIIAYFIYKPVKWVEANVFQGYIKRNKLRRVASILTIYIIVFILLASFLSFSIPRIGKNLTDLVIGVPQYIEKTGDFLIELDINKRIQNFVDNLPIDKSVLNEYDIIKNTNKYINDLLNNAQDTIEKLIVYIINSLISITSGVFTLLVALFIAFYILKDKEELFLSIEKYFNAFHHKKIGRWKEIMTLTDEIFGKYLIGNIIDSSIIGILCFIGLMLMDIRFAFLISIIVGVTNLIPFFGPFIGAVPGAVLTIFDKPIKSLWFLLFILVLQQFDGNILKPKVLGEKVGLSPFWVLFAILVGGGIFGIWGMFLGVPTIAVIRILILQSIERKKHPITK